MRRGIWIALIILALFIVIFSVAYYFLVRQSQKLQEKATNPTYLEEEFEKGFEKLNEEAQKTP